MKRCYALLILLALLVVSCVQTANRYQNATNVDSKKNRDRNVSFMGIRLGAPNGSEIAVIDSSELLIMRELPDGFHHYEGSGNGAIFENPNENTLTTFFTSVVDKKDDSHNGWGMIKSDGDSITTIHFILTQCDDVQQVYCRVKELLVDQYGEPDDSCTIELDDEGIAADLQNSYCYWDFSNNQRIILNRFEYVGYEYGGLFSDSKRVEIIYQDLNAVQRFKKSVEDKKNTEKQKREQAEKERKEQNSKAREQQQL